MRSPRHSESTHATRKIIGKPPLRSWLGLAGGTVPFTLGLLLYAEFSPSPHGYLELFYAIPLIAFGMLVMGMGLASGWRTIGWGLKAVAVLLILASLPPLGLVLYVRLLM